MSRSYLKLPIIGHTTAKSDKIGKRQANRAYRKIMRQRIANGIFAPFKIREISSVWDFPKDGKRYRKNLTIKDLRK